MTEAIENVDTHFYSRLHGDATLLAMLPGGVWAEQPPAGTAKPVLIFSAYVPGVPKSVIGSGDPASVIWTDFLMQVKVIGTGGSFKALYPIMARANLLLAGTRNGNAVQGVKRADASAIKYIERDGDVRYNHFGYIYRVIARDT